MLTYTLCLIRKNREYLLLNRENPTWMGCWNGIGGKIEKDEQPRESMVREIREETMIHVSNISFRGIITWSTVEGDGFGGMYLYEAPTEAEFEYPTPLKTEEGILDWKKDNWILDQRNMGVATNLRSVLNYIIDGEECFNHHSIFLEGKMIDHRTTRIDPIIEEDEALRKTYLEQYIREYIKEVSGTR